jgi:hypothetical protein
VVDVAWHVPAGVGTRRSDWPIASPRTVLTRATEATTRVPDCPDQAILLGRLKSGMALESQRVVHVFQATPELRDSAVAAARCGATLATRDLQWLPRFAGMPCERCVMNARD